MEWGNNVIKSKDESLNIEAAVKLTAAFFISHRQRQRQIKSLLSELLF